LVTTTGHALAVARRADAYRDMSWRTVHERRRFRNRRATSERRRTRGGSDGEDRQAEHSDHLGDDIGWFNVSMNNNGIMGYRTPNIDRVAKEGCNFTDWYGQQSCTAGRAAFITGQSPIRTGLTKVGLPGADLGLQPEDPTIADVLKPLGYVSGQFGKNHLGDRDEFLPTAHGFDEFFGNLYHLNAEQEPECPDYPKDPEFKKKYGPRGVLHTWANPDGTQKIENTGDLTIKRMETVDEEFLDASLKFMEKAVKDDKPFFCWWNSTRMHIFTHLKKESEGKTGLGIYPDGMVEHDGPRRQAARQARRARHRRQHHRDVFD
jgi:arylsulfatase